MYQEGLDIKTERSSSDEQPAPHPTVGSVKATADRAEPQLVSTAAT